MYKQSRKLRTVFTDTVNLNNNINMLLREQMVVTDSGDIMFGDEIIKSPGQLGIKVMQLIDYVRDEVSFKPHEPLY